ncbi:SCO family protein [Pontibacter korlensis]|uniref:Thioredoxin domain-containing protein n=1 Tax=Pontibacter korlensis TaxID=400092 RepID=A0A0E3ZFK3_9BACT|nr:SCO family protein [Pontibacter korlensis]AKD03574.1 hypothetical protein PKOR_11050 [Pontibacter korlensis]
MKPVKALILGILLLVPILIFIFISVFGTHHFSLKTYYPKLDDFGKVVLNAAGDTVFQYVPYFELESHTGVTVQQSDLDESIFIASFFSPACTDSCLKVFSQLVRVQEVFENNPDVKLVSIGVNPLSDSLQSVQNLAQEYQVNSDKWFLLIGDTSEVVPLVTEGFHERYEMIGDTIAHSHRLVLVDKEKNIRGVYKGADPEDADRLILEINVLLDEYSKRK